MSELAPPVTKPVSMWILMAFFAGGVIGGTFAAMNGNWFDVGLAAVLVGFALIGLRSHAPEDPAPKRKPLALLVDDDESVREVLEAMLQREGFDVSAVGSGQEALDGYSGRVQAVGVLVTDLGLPGMSGTELAREFRGLRSDLPVLFVTGELDTGYQQAWVDQAGVAFLTKPFTLDSLSSALAALRE